MPEFYGVIAREKLCSSAVYNVQSVVKCAVSENSTVAKSATIERLIRKKNPQPGRPDFVQEGRDMH